MAQPGACLPGAIACTIPAMKNLKSAVLRTILLAGMLWLPFAAYAAKNILVFGDSLSAGYGIAAEQSWPHLLQQELRATHPGYDIVNASISGETTAGGRQRISQALQQHRPVIVVVALGTNDGLRGYRIADIEANLEDIVTKARRAGARVLLAGIKLPPNYSRPYVMEFEDVFSRLAKKHRAALLPFLLDGLIPAQLLPDNLHPAAEAQPRIMRNVMEKLKPLLN